MDEGTAGGGNEKRRTKRGVERETGWLTGTLFSDAFEKGGYRRR